MHLVFRYVTEGHRLRKLSDGVIRTALSPLSSVRDAPLYSVPVGDLGDVRASLSGGTAHPRQQVRVGPRLQPQCAGMPESQLEHPHLRVETGQRPRVPDERYEG